MRRDTAIVATLALLTLSACGRGADNQQQSATQAAGANAPASAGATPAGMASPAGGAAAATAPASTASPAVGPQQSLMTQNRAQKQVTFKVVTAMNADNHGWNYDGYANGAMTMVVPQGWQVTINFQQEDPLTPHSAGIVEASPAKLPASGADVRLAFSSAATPQYAQGVGLGPHRTDSFSFTADRAGQFLLMCGVPGHAVNGMWDHFDVVSGADSAAIHLRTPS
jgi:sulfocyanin